MSHVQSRALLLAITMTLLPCASFAAEMPKELATRLSDAKIDEDRFTALCAEAVRAADPEATVSVVAPFKVAVTSQGAKLMVGFENPWRASPGSRAQAVWNHVQQLRDVVQASLGKVMGELSEIVPLVRGEVEASVQMIKAGKYNQIGERLAGDLWVIYAFNKPTHFMPVTDADLKRLKLERAQLRATALKNLRQQIPPVEKRGGAGTWMFILPKTGGNFEASLLLFDELWDGKSTEKEGDFVVAVPARDILLVTGSRSKAGVEKVSALAAETFAGGDHPISKQVLIRRKGKWETFQAQ
ncbi:DUF1444 family protein [Vitiosangium sp. GDMCC 1.1324]|uniref:DUF1444 family protein n=1 Tax=Vitiosangium sp. (strain GDMCC 1.1324) TaxID=2138576 RepID=UPI000D35300F|nr:DUF1444 family protein [Vitiosangium sp. GDMCC 1.1324]PTL83385.1 hypothetical protein DAT35_15530 [Vitiosangium sp. GDMCC 1.1324]